MAAGASERFRPARVEGWADVDEVAVLSDRLEVHGRCGRRILPFWALAKCPRSAWFWKLAFVLGWRRQFLSVADRDWFHPEGEKYFRFYTSPPLTIYIPAEAEDVEMTRKLFLRVRFLIGSGGYGTFDLG